MMRILGMALVLGCVWGCSPTAPPATAPDATAVAAAPIPPPGLAEAMPGCTWGEVSGAGVSMWRFTCPGDTPYEADASLPGIVDVFADPNTGASERFPVVQLFDIAAGADMASILPAVRAASPAPGNEECVFAPSEAAPGKFELQPTGALKAKYQLFLDGTAEEPVMPCGQMGPSEGGQRLFFPLPGSATKIAVVFMPSDMAVFDPETIKAAE